MRILCRDPSQTVSLLKNGLALKLGYTTLVGLFVLVFTTDRHFVGDQICIEARDFFLFVFFAAFDDG
jgi:hypothetical protein